MRPASEKGRNLRVASPAYDADAMPRGAVMRGQKLQLSARCAARSNVSASRHDDAPADLLNLRVMRQDMNPSVTPAEECAQTPTDTADYTRAPARADETFD